MSLSLFGWYTPSDLNLEGGNGVQPLLPSTSIRQSFSVFLASPANLELTPIIAMGSTVQPSSIPLPVFPILSCLDTDKQVEERDVCVSEDYQHGLKFQEPEMELHRTTAVPRRRPPEFKYLGSVVLHPSGGIVATQMSLKSDYEVRAGRDRRFLGIQPVKNRPPGTSSWIEIFRVRNVIERIPVNGQQRNYQFICLHSFLRNFALVHSSFNRSRNPRK